MTGATVTVVNALVAKAGNDINMVSTKRGTSIDKTAALASLVSGSAISRR